MRLTRTGRRLWRRLQVELQGQYSLDRLRQVKRYSMRVSVVRVCWFCVFTPLPCVAVTMGLDQIHVEATSVGASRSPRLWLRFVLSLWLFTVFLLIQQRQLIPQLELSRLMMLGIATLSSVATVSALFGIALRIGYPVPFTGAGGLFLWLSFLLVFLFVGSRLRALRSARGEMKSIIGLRHCAVLLLSQMTPTCIYALFNAGYEAVATTYQPLFICLLPLLKVATKNAISYSLQDIDDLKPQAVIFNVEIFHALFVACSMQTASTSLVNVFALVTVGVFQSASSLHDLFSIVDDLKPLQAKLSAALPGGCSPSTADLLALARLIAETDRSIRSSNSIRASTWHAEFAPPRKRTTVTPTDSNGPASELASVSGGSVRTNSMQSFRGSLIQVGSSPSSSHIPTAATDSPSPVLVSAAESPSPTHIMPLSTSRSFASKPTLARIQSGLPLPVPRPASSRNDQLIAAFKSLRADDRILLVQKTLQILYVTEFVALVEYTEVVMPLIYVLCLLISFNGTNRQSFLFLRRMDERGLLSTVGFVLLYALMELTSLLVMAVVVWRKLRVSLLHQLAFVLDTQWVNIQSKLIVWVVYVVQTSLVQLGADYSFQFKWLHPSTK